VFLLTYCFGAVAGFAAVLLPSQQAGFGDFLQHAAPLSQHLPWSQQAAAFSQQAAFSWQQFAVAIWVEANAVMVRPRERMDRASILRFMNFS
jgi:hypothetical protein